MEDLKRFSLSPPLCDSRSVGDLTANPDLAVALGNIRAGHSEMNVLASRQSQYSDQEAFRCEDGTSSAPADRSALKGNILLESPETETMWYFKYFLGRTHQNYITSYVLGNASQYAVLSVVVETHSLSGTATPQCRAICWRLTGSDRIVFPLPKGSKQPIDPKALFARFGVNAKKVDEILDPDVQQDLIIIEEQEGAVNFKFGVLFAKKGQRTDDEMFSNEHGSKDFDDFCSLLGPKIELQGHTAFRGGLDVKSGSTGDFCHYTVDYGKEIMFHVSTLLPFSKDNPQQLERKRHLGNDICNIVFQEDPDTPFFPEMIKSKFNHIFALVSKSPTGAYVLKVYSKNSVPEYGPALPNPAEFPDAQEFRHFLLTKLLNGEKSALASPNASFAIKRRRTLSALLSEINDKYIGGKKYSSKRNSTRGSPKSPKKQASHEHTFREFGQSLKIGKIATNAAPTSTLSGSGTLKTIEPWAPVCVSREMQQQLFCGDAWHDDIVIGSNTGVHRVKVEVHAQGSLNQTMLIDDSLNVVQIRIEPDCGLMFIRTAKTAGEEEAIKYQRATVRDSGKGATLYCVPLSALSNAPLNRKSIKPYELKHAKGTNGFECTLSPNSSCDDECLLVVLYNKRVRTFEVKSGAAFADPAVVRPLAEFVMSDPVVTASISSSQIAMGAAEVCLSLTNGTFHIFSAISGKEQKAIPFTESYAIEPVGFEEVVGDNEQTDFMISYNQLTVFRDREGQPSRPFDVKWNSRLVAVVHVYPYLLGFSSDSVEVVTLINGSLVKTVPFAGLSFFSSQHDIIFATKERTNSSSLYKMSREGLSGKSMESELAALPRHMNGRKMSTTDFGAAATNGRFRRRRSSSNPATPTPTATILE